MLAAGAAILVWLGVIAAFAARVWVPSNASGGVLAAAAFVAAAVLASMSSHRWRQGRWRRDGRHVVSRAGSGLAQDAEGLGQTLWFGGLSLAAVAFAIASMHLMLSRPQELMTPGGSPVSAVATLRTDVRTATDWTGQPLPSATSTAILTHIRIGTHPVLGRVPARLSMSVGASRDLTRGSRIRIRLRVTGYEPWGSPGLRVRALSISGADPPGPLLATVHEMRSSMRQVLGCCDRDAGALLAGLAIGADEQQSDGLRDAMRRSGLSHLTAVSGGNISILVGVVLWLAAWSGLRLHGRILAGLVAVCGYVFIVGWEPSVLRAGVMGTVALLAVLRGGGRGGIGLLGGSVVVLLLAQPELAVSWGMALSVAATAGIIVFAGRWQAALTARYPRVPAPLFATLTVTAAAQVATAPLLAAMVGQVSMAALPANAAAAALVAPITVLGLLSLLLAWPAPGIAEVTAGLGSAVSGVLAEIAHRGAALPLAAIDLPGGWRGAGLVGVAMMASGITWLLLRGPLSGRPPESDSDSIDPAEAAGRGSRGTSLLVMASGAAAAFVLAMAAGPSTRAVPGHWEVIACDVGQGDAYLARVGPQSAVLVDTGEHPDMLLACLDQAGVNALPLVFLTHFDTDHVAALPELLRAADVGRVVLAPVPEPPKNFEQIDAELAARAIPHEVGTAGAAWRIGPTEVELLWPERIVRAGGAAGNNSSLVVRVRAAVDVLFTGDLEPPGQLALMHAHDALQVEVTTIPHHGSANQHPRFAAWTGADLALVSAGRDNRFGHPREAALDRFRDAGMRVGRTDRHGTIVVTREPTGSLALHSFPQ